MNVICLRHPGYKPPESPMLSCKTCCAMFLAELKRMNGERGDQDVAPEKWLEEKHKLAKARLGFDPQSI